MSSDHIQPEPDWADRPRVERGRITGRAWVKCDLEFWRRCTVEADHGGSITVLLDNMDELTVPPNHVRQMELEPGDLVFVQHWEGCISGLPAFVHRVKNEAIEVDFPVELFGESKRRACTLRDLCFYMELPPIHWRVGVRVFAYKAVRWEPHLFLVFPARVVEIHNEICAQVEFVDGAKEYVPITLVDRFDVSEGDMVYTCTTYLPTAGWERRELWTPCRVVQRQGRNLLLQDDTGKRFETPLELTAILPRGYRMMDGKLEKIPDEPAAPPAANGDVYVVRTDDWRDAADNPITPDEADALIASDIELAWSDQWVRGDRLRTIRWRGQRCFNWHRGAIRCTKPSEAQLAKMIAIAIALDANVVGEDGTEYH